jgi:primosomal protein N' (replication factor Y)
MSQLPLLEPSAAPEIENTLKYCTVVIPPLAGEFLYSFAPQKHPDLAVGDVIEVPLGRRTSVAFVVSSQSDRELKALSEIASRGVKVKQIVSTARPAHAFNAEHLEFYDWIARYYAEPLSKILDLAIPNPSPEKPTVSYRLKGRGPDNSDCTQRLGPAQQRVVDYLAKRAEAVDSRTLRADCAASASVLKNLLEKGLIELTDNATSDDTQHSALHQTFQHIDLNAEQTQVVSAILQSVQEPRFTTALVHGVTGSGKTEVYLALIMEALRQNRSALVIVPEIALTPQLTERFISRLNQPVAVLHSSLRPKERWQHWSNLASGRVRIAIGARSALFAPVHNLGIIVVDEEHDSSFKQGEGIRYHARDLALVRGKLCHCPVVLGSATPSLETYQNALTGKYTHLTLTQRYHDAANSEFTIIDLNAVKPWEMKSKNISPTLFSALHTCLDNGGQAFILYNRRGFASYLQCSSCEHVLGCPHCSVTLTFHRQENSLLCHQCNFSMVPPSVCSACGAQENLEKQGEPLFTQRGSGTERVHEEVHMLFPKARVATLDRDTASSIEDYTEILGKVREREIDVLVGTQMIAKGHDLPGVTFVGIVDCDVGLHVPDFRAAERSFQLLTQVAGRAGRRSTRGQVMLQTRVPKHPSLAMTAQANYKGFAEQELELRRALDYPPFSKLLRIIVSAADRSEALQIAGAVAHTIRARLHHKNVACLGPAPAPIEKIRTLWRYHILLKSKSAGELQSVMKQLKQVHATSDSVRIAYDLDPHDML